MFLLWDQELEVKDRTARFGVKGKEKFGVINSNSFRRILVLLVFLRFVLLVFQASL